MQPGTGLLACVAFELIPLKALHEFGACTALLIREEPMHEAKWATMALIIGKEGCVPHSSNRLSNSS